MTISSMSSASSNFLKSAGDIDSFRWSVTNFLSDDSITPLIASHVSSG